MTTERSVLPVRPLGLRMSFYLRRTAFGLFLAAFAAGSGAGAVWAISDAWSIRRDQRIWDSGTQATDGMVHGKVRSRGLRWVIAFYDLDVTYADADGARYRGPVEIATMLGSVDTDADPEVRYDPADPDRFALSWAVDASGARWRWVVIGGALFGAIALLFAWVTRGWIQETLAIRQCARRGREVVVRIADVLRVDDDRGRRTTKARYTLLVPAPDGADDQRWLEELDLARGRPLFADPTEGTAHALIGPGANTRILLCDSLYPLALTAAERREVHARAAPVDPS
jgi:hypothetical protein